MRCPPEPGEHPDATPFIVDPFHGGALLSEVDCARLLRTQVGAEALVDPSMLQTAGKRAILLRMLLNLFADDKKRCLCVVLPQQVENLRRIFRIRPVIDSIFPLAEAAETARASSGLGGPTRLTVTTRALRPDIHPIARAIASALPPAGSRP